MSDADNFILPQLSFAQDAVARVAVALLERSHKGPAFCVIGDAGEARTFRSVLAARGHDAIAIQWAFGQEFPAEAVNSDRTLVLLTRPVTASHWEQLQTIAERLPGRTVGVNELLLPLGLLQDAMKRLPYAAKSWEELIHFYCGDGVFGARLDELQTLFPLRGKTVVEFGPLDGLQTAFLVNNGASRVTCVEARPENATKTLIAKQVFGWGNVQVAMDDFHNVSGSSYGKFDLAFAHGVYYHTIAPFVFLENLVSLSDHIYLGGYCATDANPKTAYVALDHDGQSYRAKPYRESGQADFYAGVNPFAYFLDGDDLQAFFRRAGYGVQVIDDMLFDATQCAGRYIWFFAQRG